MNRSLGRLARVCALPVASLAALATTACDGGSDNLGTASGCAKVGDAVALPVAVAHDIALGATGYEVVIRGEDGTTKSYHVDDVSGIVADGVRAGLPSGGAIRAIASGSGVVAASVWGGTATGITVATLTEDAWTSDSSVPAAQGRTFTYGSDVAVRADGTVFVLWLAEKDGEMALLVATWSKAAGFGAYDRVPVGDAIATLGVEVAATFDGAGQLRVVVSGADAAGASGVYALARGADGAWVPARRLGDLHGSTQGDSLIALQAGSFGARGFAVEPADFAGGADGQLSSWDLASGSTTAQTTAPDKRPVVGGVDAATLLDGRSLITASWGANNANAAQSDDEVLVYSCDGTRCREALVIDGRKGYFYDSSRIAIRGQEGAVVYNAEKKGGGTKETRLQRFRCFLPSE